MQKFAKYMPTSAFPDKKGSAFQFGTTVFKDSDKIYGTLEMVGQSKPKPAAGSTDSPFEWSEKLLMVVNDRELGQLLAVLRGRVESTKIIHKYPTDAAPAEQTTTTFALSNSQTGDVGAQMSQKRPDKEYVNLSIYLKPEDSEVLIVLLSEAIRQMYNVPFKTKVKTSV